jgi:hypothetical protein
MCDDYTICDLEVIPDDPDDEAREEFCEAWRALQDEEDWVSL